MQRRSALASFCSLFCASVCSAVGIRPKQPAKPLQGAFVCGGLLFAIEGEATALVEFFHVYKLAINGDYAGPFMTAHEAQLYRTIQRVVSDTAAQGSITVFAGETLCGKPSQHAIAVKTAIAATGCRVVSPESLRSVF